MGINQVRKRLSEILEEAEYALTPINREGFAEQYERLRELDEIIQAHDLKINPLCQTHTLSRRLGEAPGIGPLTATIVAAD